MRTVVVKPFVHRGHEVIGIDAPYVRELDVAVRKLKGVQWSQTNKRWCLALSRQSHQAIVAGLKPLAIVEQATLRTYLQKRKLVNATAVAKNDETNVRPNAAFTKPVALTPAWNLNTENIKALGRFVEQLKLRAYSPSTQKTYRKEFLQLLQLLKKKNAADLTAEDLRRYFVYCFEQLSLSENTLHSRINAVKFYFEQVLRRERFFWAIPRPKKAEQLPKILSQAEVAALLNGVTNKKHRTMLMLAYSAGLRVSEVVSIKTVDIDSSRMTIFLHRAKGKKDRVVPLSPVLLVMLREYARFYKPDKAGYLFAGQEDGRPYSERSLQLVLQEAKQRAGIVKPGGIHLLRHSFATHLVERGTDVTMIQKLLGHNSVQTTMRYLHTSNKDVLRIISPLDDLPLQ